MATVPTTPRNNRFTLATTSAGPFLVGFRLFAADGLDVYVNGVKQTSGFTVAATFVNGYDDNATVTFTTPQVNGTVIQFDGALIPGRSADYANPDPTLTAKLNAELARLWSSVSEINQLVRRSVRSLDPIEAVDGIDPEDIENLPANLAAASQAASDATSAAASATLALNQVLAIQDSLPSWRGPWLTATAYGIGDLVSQSGNSYICIVAHTSGTFSTDLSALRWQIFAEKGAAGAGTGDMLAANNLSDVVNKPAALATLGGQPSDTDLTALAGISATGLLARTGSGTAAARTLTPGAGISITNGDGVSGNPTVAVSGLTTSEIAAATLVTAAEGIGANNNDTTIPTSAAVKAYADTTGRLTFATPQATTSGTQFDFGSIPAGVSEIEVVGRGVSLSGTDHLLVQLGTSGGFVTTGYDSYTLAFAGGSAVSSTSTSGMTITLGAATRVFTGVMRLIRSESNTWVATINGGHIASTLAWNGGGEIALAAALTQIRVTRSGTNTFDAGSVTVGWR